MTPRSALRWAEHFLPAAGPVALVFLLLSAAAWPQSTASSPAGKTAAELKRDFDRCRTTANLDVCDDAIRWNPSDPPLLVAQGDALMRAQRPADAIRAYQRAAALAPTLGGIDARVSAAQAKIAAMHAPRKREAAAPPAKQYSNDAPDAQSH